LATAHAQVLSADVRLLTLVGPGGVGKTRLAIALAESVQGNAAYSDVRFVDLAPLPEGALVPAAIARALGAPQPEDGTARASIRDSLGRRRMLVVLDNFEHVLQAASAVGELLAECPGLVFLVTSREPLHLRWERTLPLGPLAVPDPKHLPPLDRLAAVPAVTLFIERARAADPGFLLAAHNAGAIAELCVRLDGLPLAIELVAARAAQLGPATALERLARRLPLPASTMQDAPARQQTLRATMQWSVDLLDAAEQALFRRLAVFAGGWTLEAAEAVAASRDAVVTAEGPDVLSGLMSLVDKSLVQVHVASTASSELRFRMLETAREFALTNLEISQEADTVRGRHAEYFATLAEQAAPQLQGSEQSATAARLEGEQDNFRQALRWTLGHGDPEALDTGLRLAGALGWFWFLRGYPAEARGWFEVLLRPTDGPPSAVRARALNAAGFRAIDHAEYAVASRFHEQALAIWRELHDVPGMVASLHGVADSALWQADSELARERYEEGLALAATAGTSIDIALFAFHLGQLWWLLSDLDAAEKYAQQGLDVARAAGSTTWAAYALYVLASLAHEREDVSRAGALYREALQLAWTNSDRLCVRMALPGLAGLAVLEGDTVRALRLAAAASSLEHNAGIVAFPPIRARQERWLAPAYEAFDAATRALAWTQGQEMTWDEVMAYAQELAEPGAGPAAAHATGQGRLSRREREVLALVAEGRSNREIGAALIISENTAKYHVAQLLNKLGAGSRAEAVTRAVGAGLLAPNVE
jgi:predicted ATPase/DNA-binding CsgD family transcriptional regulator